MAQGQEGEQTGRRRGLTPGQTKGLMVLVVVITAIAIWLVPVEERKTPSLPPPPSQPDTASRALPLPATPGAEEELPQPAASADTAAMPGPSPQPGVTEELLLPPPPGGIGTVTTGGDRARTFIYEQRAGGAEPDPEVVFAEAERMQDEGSLEDAYLLYRFAARHGHAQAALILGSGADPAYHDTETAFLPEPDAAQAYKWYSVAANAGNDEARQRLQALRQRVQQEAAAGDAQARRLALQWR
jgi:hypothetical protein